MMFSYHVTGPSIKDKKQDFSENRKGERREKEVVVQQGEEGQEEALDAPGEEGVEEEGEDRLEEEVLTLLRTPMILANGEIVTETVKQSDKREMDLVAMAVTYNPMMPHMTCQLHQRQRQQQQQR